MATLSGRVRAVSGVEGFQGRRHMLPTVEVKVRGLKFLASGFLYYCRLPQKMTLKEMK